MRFVLPALLAPVLLTAACGPARSLDANQAPVALRAELTEEAEQRVLWAANTLGLEVLDDEVGLDSRAALGIVSAREITPFLTIAQLDGVPYVGPSALNKLDEWTLANAPTSSRPDEVELYVHGILAGGINASRVLSVANTASLEELDHAVGLDSRAAQAIVDARFWGDLWTLEELDALPYVGNSAFQDLFGYALETDAPLEPGCPNSIIRDRAGNVYWTLDDAVASAGNNGHLTLCEGVHGDWNQGYYRTDGLSFDSIGSVVVRGYLNLADADYEVKGVLFEGVGSGINAFATSIAVENVAFGDDTHLFVTESDGWFDDLYMSGADELQLENGSYTIRNGAFDGMAPRTEGYSPIYASYAEVVFIDSQFRNNPNRAVFVAPGSDVLFYDSLFGEGATSNPDGDVVIDGTTLNGLGYVDGYRCVAGQGCALD